MYKTISNFDRAEAAITRLLKNGRAYVTGGAVMTQVRIMVQDAELTVRERWSLRGGWWITLEEVK